MGQAIIDEETLTGIADAIRTRKGTSDLIPTPNMRSEILSISGGGGESHREVASIIADGASYIKTDIYPNPNYTIEMECRLHTIVDDRYDFFFGTRFGDAGRWQARFDTSSSSYPNGLRVQRSPLYNASGSGNWIDTGTYKADWMDFKKFRLEKNKVYIDEDDTLIGNFTASASIAHYPFALYLFSVNDSEEESHAVSGCGHIECKYVKIWDNNDNLVADFVPVVKMDGTVCMYDKVNKRYYYNAGTGTFTYTE